MISSLKQLGALLCGFITIAKQQQTREPSWFAESKRNKKAWQTKRIVQLA